MSRGQLKLFSGSAHPRPGGGDWRLPGRPAGARPAAAFSGHGGVVPDRREHPRHRRLHRAADLRGRRRNLDRAVRDDRCVPPLVGVAHHRGDSVLRLRPAGSQGQAARADLGEAGRQPAERGRGEPGADDGSAQGADPGVFRHPGRSPVRGAGHHRLLRRLALPEPDDRLAGRGRRGAGPGLRQAARRASWRSSTSGAATTARRR